MISSTIIYNLIGCVFFCILQKSYTSYNYVPHQAPGSTRLACHADHLSRPFRPQLRLPWSWEMENPGAVGGSAKISDYFLS